MSQSGYTPIQLYRTTTAAATPTSGNLAAGELAINLTDEKLYFKNAGGTVKLLASTDTLGTVTSVAASGGTTGLTFSGSPITTSGTLTLGGTLGVANGGTGTTTAFTAGSIVFAGASGVYSQDNGELFWDNANNRLGVGTPTPAYRLDAAGTINTTQALRFSASHFEGAATYSISNYLTNMVFNVPTGSGFGWAINGGDAMLINSSGNVSIIGTGNGTLTLTSSAGAYSSVINMNSSAGGGSAINASQFLTLQTGSTERMRVDSAGQVGIGVTPATWFGNSKVLQIGSGGALEGRTNLPNLVQLSANAYLDAAGVTKYLNTAAASSYLQYLGAHTWYTAASGTAGATVSFTQAMTLDTSGRLFLGATTGVGNEQMLVAFNSSGSVTQAINMRDNNASGNGNSFIVLRRSDDTYLGAIGRSGTDSAMFVEGNSYLSLRTGGTERFRITSTGGITSSDLADAVGYKGLPQNSQTGAYTLALSDMGKHISITTGGVVIPANGSVAFPIGATIVVFNNSGSTQTISITTDTLRQAGTTSTGSRTLAVYGLATLVKVTSTVWVVTGNIS